MSGGFGYGGGNFKPRTHEASKFTTVKLTIAGDHFEILVNPDSALSFKQGRNVEPSAVVVADEVYSDARKGLRASTEKLRLHFGTDDHAKAVLEVLKRGELNLTQEQRKRLTEEKRKAIIAAISKNFVDPRTLLPHPPTRIDQAMQEARVSVDPFQDPNEQMKAVVEALRTLLPLKSEKVRLQVKVSAQYTGQAIGVLKAYGEIMKEDWLADGTLSAIVEIPAGGQPGLLDRLGSTTKGAAQVTVVK
ncbi:MAG: ribosome assembly factor SBDS [Nitrososphaerota archaeon]|jgi:ribosome maturation protein SDO1|nr:ribosome assembly factor SBDS [Nitrososphaerota archaeon]MDG6964425.1 ribosome assembly factor SBDS [Nitrososphaerota archaeon]MDG6974232.1 ribosome assembly factor SBDS [Nitrososphaerota archaeon]MDG6974793.1 ribosome assembly factor SBDS [Nitrososphaerota archaeon]MDG7010355.1 ribosome assembly factor SBDS [Nitrososphaerota archaeon]